MFDMDMLFDILRETCMPSNYWLKPMSYYKLTTIENYIIVVNSINIYALSLILYGKYSIPFVIESTPIIIDVVKSVDFLNEFQKNADVIILENNKELFLIAHRILDSFMNSVELTNIVTISQLADEYGNMVSDAIKNDFILYNKLLKNDILVNYIVDIIKKGFLNKNIPELLGLKLN